ncbi:MAG: hypothetical protein IJN79_05570 [Clostridia bacterium]|nr:hypothetical protein [Clostridia bacterium]
MSRFSDEENPITEKELSAPYFCISKRILQIAPQEDAREAHALNGTLPVFSAARLNDGCESAKI